MLLLPAKYGTQMPLSSGKFLLNSAPMEPEILSDLGLRLVVTPASEEYLATAYRQLGKGRERQSHLVLGTDRQFGIWRIIRNALKDRCLDGCEPRFSPSMIFRQIDGHTIEIGERVPDLVQCRFATQLQIGIMQRVSCRIGRVQAGREPGNERAIVRFQNLQQLMGGFVGTTSNGNIGEPGSR